MNRLSSTIALILITATNELPAHAFSEPEIIDSDTLHSMVVDNAAKLEGGKSIQYFVIDARMPDEFKKSHIVSAINIPVESIEQSFDQLPAEKSAQIIVYANDKELHVCKRWFNKASIYGYTNIAIYSGTFQVWNDRHLPVEPF